MTRDDLIGIVFFILCILSVATVIHGVSGSREVAYKVITDIQQGR